MYTENTLFEMSPMPVVYVYIIYICIYYLDNTAFWEIDRYASPAESGLRNVMDIARELSSQYESRIITAHCARDKPEIQTRSARHGTGERARNVSRYDGVFEIAATG